MRRARHTFGQRVARAVFAATAAACLLFSDGVGPRLVPYPEAEPRAASRRTTREEPPHVSTDHNRQRERALTPLGVKLSALKQDKAAHPTDDVAAARGHRPAALPAPIAARRPPDGERPTPPSFYSTTATPHRGPPSHS